MSAKPRIFISALSSEFKQLRQLVAMVLERLGYEPVRQDIFGTEPGDLRQMLRQKIDDCEGVIHIVGEGYGAEPPDIDPEYGRVSYTQFEFLYARQIGKKTWVLFAGEDCTRDTPVKDLDLPRTPTHPSSSKYQAERRNLQAAWRHRLKQDGHLRHGATNDTELELRVERLRDEFAELRRAERSWRRKVVWSLATVAALVLLSIGIGIWIVQSQGLARKAQQSAVEEVKRTGEAVDEVGQTIKVAGQSIDETKKTVIKLNTRAEREAAVSRVDRAIAAMDLSRQGQVKAIADLLDSEFSYAGVEIKGVNLSNADLAGHDFSKTNFRGCDLTHANFRQSILSNAELEFTSIDDADFEDAQAVEIDAAFTIGERANFKKANCQQATFFCSRLRGADFSRADLRGTDLSFCDLRDSNFQGANLEGAFFVGSDLDGATFDKAIFGNTDVSGAALSREQLSDEQFSGVGRSVGFSGKLHLDLLEKIPSDRFSTGYTYKDLIWRKFWDLPGFGDRTLPLCTVPETGPRYSRAVYVPPSRDAREISAYCKMHLEHDFIEVGDRRRQFLDRVEQHVAFLQKNLAQDRALRGDGSFRKSWEETLRQRSKVVDLISPPYASPDHLAVVLLSAGVVLPENVKWQDLAGARSNLELQQEAAKRPIPYEGWLPRDPWPPFFPAQVPLEELPSNYADIYRDWTMNRARQTDHSRITLSHRLWDRPLKEGKHAITLEDWGSDSWPSDLLSAIRELEISPKQTMFSSLRPTPLDLRKVLFVFDRDLKHFELRLDNDDLPADRSGLSVEVDLKLDDFRRVGTRKDDGEFVLIDAQPVTARIMDADRVVWKGPVAVTGNAPSEAPFRVLHRFAGGKEDGFEPVGPLAVDRDGRLYGATQKGGKYNAGTIFSLAADGSDYSILHHFIGGLKNPESPNSVHLGADGLLYGAFGGFLSRAKGIFRMATDGTGFSVLHQFENAQSAYIRLQSDDEDSIYGTTGPTGIVAFAATALFCIDKKSESLKSIYANDRNSPPVGAFLDGGDGWFYGVQNYGGDRAVFRIGKGGSGFQLLHEFEGPPLDGQYPERKPVLGRNDVLYGTTSSGGEHGNGVIYRVSKAGSEYKVLHHFERGDGSSGLVAASDGTVFGLAWIENSQRVALHHVDPKGVVSRTLELPGSYNGLQPMTAGPDGVLYGVLISGLTHQVFRIVPPADN